MKTPRKQKKTAVKLARGPSHTSADARLTPSMFGGSLLSLESRIMFDGAAVATAGKVTTEQIAQSQTDVPHSDHDAATADTAPDAPTSKLQPTNGDQALFDALAAYDSATARHEILFVSASVHEYQQLLDGISPNVEVYVLDPAKDGVTQMAEVLAGRTGIDAIHLIGDGTEAEMHLGASFLTQESISTAYAEQFQQIGRSLSADADLLIYGCDFGRGEAGQLAMNTLADLTGADVAASTDRTGSAAEYADWQLEVTTGSIETSVVINESTQAEWDHALATFTVTTNTNNGVGSLRQAINDANNAAGTDTIVFNIAGGGLKTFSLNSALPTITDRVTIDGYTQAGSSVNTLSVGDNAVLMIELDGTSAGGNGLTLGAGSDGSTIRGLVINRFSLDGIQINSTNNLIVGNWIGVDSTGTLDRGNTVDGITVSANNNTIGTSAAADRNVISGNNDEGIDIDPGISGVIIRGNYIGTNASGTAAIGNGQAAAGTWGGVLIDGNNNTLGGSNAGDGNLISGNFQYGVLINGTGNSVLGNKIGTDASGTAGVGNVGDGVRIGGSANSVGGTAVGAGNLIAFNTANGINITAGTDDALLGNQIHSNTLLGINLGAAGVTANDAGDGDAGANNLQNFPVLTSAQIVSSTQVNLVGSLNSTANSQLRIEFFSNTVQDGTGFGEGQTYLGFVNVTTDGSGNANFNTTLAATVSAGNFISATATRSNATFTTFTDTSEFAQDRVVPANTAPVLDASKSPALTAINEDAGAPVGAVGTLVSALVDFALPAGQVDNVTDPNLGALLGLAVTAADTTNGTWFYSTNNGASWNALGAVATANARLLAADANTRLYFQPNGNYNGTLASAITFRAWDQTSGANGALADTSTNGGTTAFSTATDTAALTVNAVNDAPTATITPLTYSATEQISLTLHGTGLSVADIDAGAASVTATVSVTSGTISAAAGTTGVTVAGSGTATVTLTGTLTQINNLLAGNLSGTLTYLNSSDTPPPSATLTLSVDDGGNTGTGGALVGSDTATINLTSVDDAPVNMVPGAQTVNEDTSLVFSSGNGNLIAISDVDAGGSSVQVTLTGTNGTVTLAGTGGLTFSVGDGTADATMTFTGTVANINTALAGMNFAPTANFNGAASLQIVTNDQGNTGSGGPLSDTDTVNITVLAVNDAPVNTVPGAQVVNEDTALAVGGISVTDVDGNLSTVQLAVANGTVTVTLSGTATISAGGNGTNSLTLSGSQADINTTLASLIYQGTLNYNGPDTLTMTSRDSNAGTDVDTVAITVLAVNDAPTATNLSAAEIYIEDTALNLIDIVASDVDSANITATLTLSDVVAGSLSTGTSGAVTSTFVGGVWTASGALADVNALLAGVTFNPALNYNSNFTIATSVSDGVAPAITGVKAMTGIPINDAPVNTVPGAQVVNEDTALAVGGISVTDVDGNLSTVQLAVANGTVTVTLSGTATISAGGNGTNSLTLSGSQADINATLASLTYQGTLNYNGPDTLTVTSTDGNAVTDVDTVAITVNPVNSIPSLATNAGSTVVQGLTDLITSGELQVTDTNNTPAQLTYTVTTSPVDGRLELTTAPGVAITSFTQADINAGRLVFVHSGAGSTSDSFTFTVSDGAGGTIGATTFNFTVTPFVPPPPPPPPPPGPGPVPVPVPVPVPGPPGPIPGGVVNPVLQPSPVLVTVVGATDDPVKRVAMPSRKFVRVEQPDIVLEEPSVLPLEPLSLPVKKMLAVGHKLAERLTRLADGLERSMQEREHRAHLLGRVVSFSGMALSAGFVAWILRGGSLLASFLVSMPAWRRFDPLPVLSSGQRDRRKHDRKAREEQAQETKEFRGLDRVLKSSAKPAKWQETGRMRRPKP